MARSPRSAVRVRIIVGRSFHDSFRACSRGASMEMSIRTKRKPGRPSLGRTDKLQIRLTPSEKAIFERIAENHGLSLSDWVRSSLRALSSVGSREGDYR
jgi:hypothetical protein